MGAGGDAPLEVAGGTSNGEAAAGARLAVVIYNPLAGASLGEEVAQRAASHLEDRGFRVERCATRAQGGAVPVAREVAARADRIVVVGGDGTLREAIEGLGDARARIPIGLVPMGNANVVARELGVPSDPDEAIRLLVDGEPVEVDVGHVRTEAFEDLFLAVVGVGWDALTVGLLDRLRRTPLGRLWYRIWADSLYAVAGLLAALRLNPERCRMTVDGVARPASYCAAYLCNLRTYGKGMAMAPDAHRSSGRLHFQARKRSLLPFLAWHLLAALRGRRSPAFISDYGDGRHIELRGERPFPVEIDGDPRGSVSSLEVEVEPSALRIIAPTGRERPSAA